MRPLKFSPSEFVINILFLTLFAKTFGWWAVLVFGGLMFASHVMYEKWLRWKIFGNHPGDQEEM